MKRWKKAWMVLKTKKFWGFVWELSLLTKTPDVIFLHLANLRSALNGKPVRFRKDRNSIFFVASDGGGKEMSFSNKKRGYWVYRNGVGARGGFLWASYCLAHITFRPDDIVIDCGANSGDLFLQLREHIPPQNYFAIEPNPMDYRVLARNIPLAHHRFFALGEADRQSVLYVQTSRADSSLIEPRNFESTVSTVVRSLDSVVLEETIPQIKLLKVEAEGYEPEVLRGARKSLALCEYVAIDGGPERGINREATFCEISNVLFSAGFELVDVYFPWSRALFRKIQKPSN